MKLNDHIHIDIYDWKHVLDTNLYKSYIQTLDTNLIIAYCSVGTIFDWF